MNAASVSKLVCAGCLGVLVSAGASAQQPQTPPAARAESPGNGHDQPTRQGTLHFEKQSGVALSKQQSRHELRTLDQLNQQLAPGTKLPAPGLEPKP